MCPRQGATFSRRLGRHFVHYIWIFCCLWRGGMCTGIGGLVKTCNKELLSLIEYLDSTVPHYWQPSWLCHKAGLWIVLASALAMTAPPRPARSQVLTKPSRKGRKVKVMSLAVLSSHREGIPGHVVAGLLKKKWLLWYHPEKLKGILQC